MISQTTDNGITILTLESRHLVVSVVPALGGKIWRIYNKPLAKEFLWRNEKLPLQKQAPGADYDTHFLGAIDELIPNDLAETIDDIAYPDHGELWTTHLHYSVGENSITVYGSLELSGLFYSKTIRMDLERPALQIDYYLKNTTTAPRHFLWKLHAALLIEPGDKLLTGARWGQVADPAYSRFTDTAPFAWPHIESTDASVVPPKSDAVDFFYLYDVPEGELQLVGGSGRHLFRYRYDAKLFPYQWYFASYGGFSGHYTAVLEPCTNMPISVTEAKEKGQCAVLGPGEALSTTVHIYAGENITLPQND